MNAKRIQGLIDEIESIAAEAAKEPVRAEAPKGHGYKQAIAVAKLDAARDILRAILNDL